MLSNTTEAKIPTVVIMATIEQPNKTLITMVSNLFLACHSGVMRDTANSAAVLAAAAPRIGMIHGEAAENGMETRIPIKPATIANAPANKPC